MITVTCGQCGASLQIPDQFAGQRGKCRYCGAFITVPEWLPTGDDTRNFPPQPSLRTAGPQGPIDYSSRQKNYARPLSLGLCALFVVASVGAAGFWYGRQSQGAATGALGAARTLPSLADTSPPLPPRNFAPRRVEKEVLKEQRTFNMGEEANYKGICLTVKQVVPWEGDGRFEVQPLEGNCFLAADIELKNIDQQRVTTNLLSFSVINDKGQQYQLPRMLHAPEPALQLRHLAPGDIARGWICLEVPREAIELKLYYEVNSFAGEYIKIRLDRHACSS